MQELRVQEFSPCRNLELGEEFGLERLKQRLDIGNKQRRVVVDMNLGSSPGAASDSGFGARTRIRGSRLSSFSL